MSESLDFSRVTQVMGDYLAADEGWHDDLIAGRLAWILSGFDADGMADVSVLHKVTGQIVAAARVHRSALARGSTP